MEQEQKIPGYTGYKPQFVDDKEYIDGMAQRDNRYYIPGSLFDF